MLKETLRLCQAASSISKSEFLDAISHVCPAVLNDGGQKLGLAISGGVDSMALAAMCRKYLPRNGTQLRAFIVDHGLRPSSEEEALKTQKHLSTKLDIESDILKLDPAELGEKRSVETWARKSRYDALGSSYRKCGLDGLLTAHHSGDQYETALFRLSIGARSALGIKAVAKMPNPEDLHRVASEVLSRIDWPLLQSFSCFGVNGIMHHDMPKLLRPLLAFDKTRLEATCHELGVHWINDESNLDPTLTPRNAIRHVISHSRLPEALEFERVTEMVQLKMRRRQKISELADHLFNLIKIQLDLRTGSVLFKFPSAETLSSMESEFNAELDYPVDDAAWVAFQKVVSRIALIVSPTNGVRAFKEVDTPFMKAFLRINAGLGKPEEKTIRTMGTIFSYRGNGIWLVSRQPRQEMKLESKGLDGYIMRLPPASRPHYQLWHGCYWIRVYNLSSQDLILRAATRHDFEKLGTFLRARTLVLRDVSDPDATPRSLEAVLKSLQSTELKFNLPVLVSRAASGNVDDTESWLRDSKSDFLLAFPTLNLRVEGRRDGLVPDWVHNLTWDIRYKSIDIGGHRLKDVLALPESNDRLGWEEWPGKPVNIDSYRRSSLPSTELGTS